MNITRLSISYFSQVTSRDSLNSKLCGQNLTIASWNNAFLLTVIGCISFLISGKNARTKGHTVNPNISKIYFRLTCSVLRLIKVVRQSLCLDNVAKSHVNLKCLELLQTVNFDKLIYHLFYSLCTLFSSFKYIFNIKKKHRTPLPVISNDMRHLSIHVTASFTGFSPFFSFLFHLY